jgi:hypothetical protein
MSIAAIGSGQCSNRTDDRSRREPMKVALQYQKLHSERKQRAPRSKSNLRPNPPHRGLNPSPIPRAVTAVPRKTCASKVGSFANEPHRPDPGGGTDPLIRAQCRGLSIGYYRGRSGDHYSITSLARPASGSGVSDSKRLGGFEVDDQFVFRGLLDGQVGGLYDNISANLAEADYRSENLDFPSRSHSVL